MNGARLRRRNQYEIDMLKHPAFAYNTDPMDVSHILDPLNEAQRTAVTLSPGPVLVLAGAGSGKTRVLTHRICWLLKTEDISPFNILAVTFTNKAAREMRRRIEELLPFPIDGLWVGTFHGLCYRLLRSHGKEAGLPETFEIIDSQDQLRIVKRVLNDLDLDESRWPPRQLQANINRHKEEGRRARQIPDSHDYYQKQLQKVYATYETTCQNLGLVDFAEILLRTLELFRNNPSVRSIWQQRFCHLLVDEFQDTNHTQYQWIRVLTGPTDNLFAVGDDDQSIYSWRGAKIENMLNFERDFPNAQVIRLEQNYRSSGHVLAAANAVIANNVSRLGKNLWTDAGEGDRIRLYTAINERYEALFVVSTIQSWLREDRRRDSIAILYRSNAQSRVFEEALLSAAIPYRVYGGIRFYERSEIKDALAYLRLISNRDSDPSFERIVNLPPRGIGTKTFEVIQGHARIGKLSLWQAAQEVLTTQRLPVRAAGAVRDFMALIDSLDQETKDSSLHEQTERVLNRSRLLDYYLKDKSERAESRVENLKELVSATSDFIPPETEPHDLSLLDLFLTHTMLESNEGHSGEREDCVQLMTLHSAKGLEFPLVFLCGLEEGLFPSQRSLEEKGRLDEERRLFYVGMTRAMKQLYLCHAEIRQLYGRNHYSMSSRFLHEVPSEHLETISTRLASTPVDRDPSSNPGSIPESLRPGRQVRHERFGEGTIIALEGQGEHMRIQINFSTVGTKWILPSYAKLEPC